MRILRWIVAGVALAGIGYWAMASADGPVAPTGSSDSAGAPSVPVQEVPAVSLPIPAIPASIPGLTTGGDSALTGAPGNSGGGDAAAGSPAATAEPRSVTLPAGSRRATTNVRAPRLEFYEPRFRTPARLMQILRSLYPHEVGPLKTDEESNRIYFPEGLTQQWRDRFEVLDVPMTAREAAVRSVNGDASAQPNAARGSGKRYGITGGTELPALVLAPTDPLVTDLLGEQARLANEYHEREIEAQNRAAAARETTQRTAPDSPEMQAARDQLRQAVGAAFDARQAQQQAEVRHLRTRLEQLERKLNARSGARDAIIDRRVEELLHPERSWQAGDETSESSLRNGPTVGGNAASAGAATDPAALTPNLPGDSRIQNPRSLKSPAGGGGSSGAVPSGSPFDASTLPASGGDDLPAAAASDPAVSRLERDVEQAELAWRKVRMALDKTRESNNAKEFSQKELATLEYEAERTKQKWIAARAALDAARSRKLDPRASRASDTGLDALIPGDSVRREYFDAEADLMTAKRNVRSSARKLQQVLDRIGDLKKAARTDFNDLQTLKIAEFELGNAEASHQNALADRDDASRRFAHVREQLEAQIQLLEIDVQLAQTRLDAMRVEEERYRRLRELNSVSASEYEAKRLERDEAQLRLHRASTVLDLYRKAAGRLRDRSTGSGGQPRTTAALRGTGADVQPATGDMEEDITADPRPAPEEGDDDDENDEDRPAAEDKHAEDDANDAEQTPGGDDDGSDDDAAKADDEESPEERDDSDDQESHDDEGNDAKDSPEMDDNGDDDKPESEADEQSHDDHDESSDDDADTEGKEGDEDPNGQSPDDSGDEADESPNDDSDDAAADHESGAERESADEESEIPADHRRSD